MTVIRGYMAASADGYIADRDGGVGWLDPFNGLDYGYTAFIAQIRTVVMGRATYDQARGFGPDWVYAGKRGIVVTSSSLHDAPADVTAWHDDLPGLAAHLRALDDGDVWIVGGSQLQSALIEIGALDRLELFYMPVLLGNGVPLFRAGKDIRALQLEAAEPFENGVVRLDYRLS